MARPRKEIDRRTFEKLCAMMCTLEEIAGFFDVSEDTIERWAKRTYKMGFADIFKRHSAKGKMSLRRNQFELSKKSAAMCIWLGKQYLGQTDKVEQTVAVISDETRDQVSRLIDELDEGDGCQDP